MLTGLLVLLVAPPLASAQSSVEVRVTSRLEPGSVTVAPGTTVTWVNADGERHRVRSSDGPEAFDSGNLEQGERFSHTFRAEGTTRYIDERNDDDTAYHGRVVVTTTATPEPEPGTDETSEPSGPETHAVSMAGRRFSPPTLEITTGDTVRFVNDDDREHTATADDSTFDSGILPEGQAFDRTFTQAGTYSYLCLLHPDMTGTIAVADPGGSAPPPAPEPDPDPDPTPEPPSPPSGTTEPTDAGPGTTLVSLEDFAFSPGDVDIQVGDTVRFRNDGRALHTATARDGSHDSGLLQPGAVAEQTFQQPGTFDYWCTLHPDMVATIRVAAADGIVVEEAADAPTPDVAPDEEARSEGGASDPSATAAVSVVDDAFLPEVLEVTVGQEVVWTNDGEAVHTATAEDGSFDSGIVAPGETFSRSFGEPGTVAYLCSVHPGMTAEVRVLALADGASSTQTAAAAGGDGGLSVWTLELLMLGAFAVALAGFTALSRRIGARGADG